MTFLETKAIVIKVADYGESDKIITFFSEQRGKLAGIAKGAKRSKKRFVNKLEFFSLLEITAVPSRHSSLYRVEGATLLSPFPALRHEYHRYVAAMLVCELVDQWTREEDGAADLFHLLHWCMIDLARTANCPATVVFFIVHLLQQLGFSPQLDQCHACGVPMDECRFPRFSLADNSLLCPACSALRPLTTNPVSLAALKSLRMMRSLPPARMARLKISAALLADIATILKDITHFHLQREIISWDQGMRYSPLHPFLSPSPPAR